MLWRREQCVIRNHLTGTQNRNCFFFLSFFFPSTQRGKWRQTEVKRQAEEKNKKEEEQGEEGEGCQKVWTPVSLWPVKITLWAFRVSEDEGGRGIRPFSVQRGTAHASLPHFGPNLYALSSPLVSDSESVSKPIIMFVADIVDLCVCSCTYLCVLGRETCRRFFLMRWLFSIVPKPHSRGSLWETQHFCQICFEMHAAPEV